MADHRPPPSPAARWLPLESNPDVFNKLLHEAGMAKEFGVHDVFGVDDELLAIVPQPTLAILLLFPVNDKSRALQQTDPPNATPTAADKDVFFTRQTVHNACGTVALLHAVGNNLDSIKLKSDSPLANFFDRAKLLSPKERAEMLESCDAICSIHDSVARAGQTVTPNLADDVDLHFVCLVAHQNGRLYELDGRHEAPLDLGQIESSFLKSAADRCRAYMQADPDAIQFNIMALAPSTK